MEDRLETAKNLILALPPRAEQERIRGDLDREVERIDTLIDLIRCHIDKLREYRQTLISSAVTGKIDVREPVAV